jgi:pimeloyl-ACP methyl ester carboxylesterase
LHYHVLEWGATDPGRDHTVVLVHGFLDLAYSWEEVVEAGLGARFHVVAPDMRGHGDSDWVGAGGYYHFLDYLADLHEVISTLGRRRVSLVGHSMGGNIAAYYAGTYPDRIAHLALLEGLGPPETVDTGPDRVVAWLAAWRSVRERPLKTYADVAEAAARLREHDPLLDEARSLRLAAHGTTRAPDGRLRYKHDPLHATIGPYGYRVEVARRFWERIRCPVLLIEGSESTFQLHPDEVERRRAFLQRSSTARIEGAGHMMLRHRPLEVAAALGDFLARP